MDTSEAFPEELQDKLTDFDEALSGFEGKLEPLFKTPLTERYSEMNSLEKAKLDLAAAYSINSLFWVYLTLKGENPRQHGVKSELDRIRQYMSRVKEIEDKSKRQKLNMPATKRFVNSALWQQAQAKLAGGSTPSKPPTPTPGPQEAHVQTSTPADKTPSCMTARPTTSSSSTSAEASSHRDNEQCTSAPRSSNKKRVWQSPGVIEEPWANIEQESGKKHRQLAEQEKNKEKS